MTALRVGQKCVCIDDKPHPLNWRGLDGLRKGEVYTIRRIGFDVDGTFGIWLSEIIRPHQDGAPEWGELPFVATRFRPVKTTSIECFKALLAPVPTKQKEPV
jgi:hypothetical protein